MTVQDDYPAITILADACADKADDGVPEAVRAWREVARLRQWKDEATAVLAEWDKVHYECAGASAHLGRTKAENVRRELLRLRGQCEVWMNGVADIVEPWGYDRRAASGPADAAATVRVQPLRGLARPHRMSWVVRAHARPDHCVRLHRVPAADSGADRCDGCDGASHGWHQTSRDVAPAAARSEAPALDEGSAP